MKKRYIKPDMDVVMMKAQQLLAGSDPASRNITVDGTSITEGWGD